ncbi:MAG TPA: sugar ABC transporter substrate-binding protein [Chthonomonadaceae bacterium]|nr:sugar ABC transporter substrate-binding protein [Chthonomonadaceae bacterium]
MIYHNRRARALKLLAGLAALGVIGGASLAGCGGKANEESAAPNVGPGRAAAPKAGGKQIAIISPAKTSEFHVELPKGAAEEAQKLGWPPIIDQAPPKEDDYTGQVALTQDVIQKRPDAISVCGINPQALNTIVEKANAAKVPIFVHNQITPVKGDVVAYIGYDEREGGKLCGQKAAELLKQKNGDYKGKVAILEGEPGDHTNERMGGFVDALKAYPNIQVVAHQNGKWDRAMGTSITKDWLQKYPDLDLVFGCSDAMAQGASKAAADAGHPLLTIGIDGNSTALQDVRDGKLSATLAVQPKKIGATIVDTMKDFFDGKKPPQVVKTDMVVVTKENVGQFLK